MGHDANKGREYYHQNMVYHYLSNFELSAWRQWVFASKTWYRRVKATYFYFVPPVIAGYLLINWANDANEKSHLKQPGQFDNEEED